MQRVSEVMTRDVRFVSPQESLQRAAQMMNELDVGVLPVCDGERLVGMVTDRDIAVRAVASGRAPGQAHVDEVMSSDVRWAFEDQEIDEVLTQMADSQIRRIPVVSHDEQHRLVGIVALGDVATHAAVRKDDVRDAADLVSRPSTASGASTAPEQVAGRSGEGGLGQAADDSGTAGVAGTDLPRAGGHSIGAAGATGATGGPDAQVSEAGNRSGKTADTRKNFGVGGQDLQGDGLPPR